MEIYLPIGIAALAAGFIQGLTGFGAGIILMIALPLMFPVVKAAGVAQSIGFAMTLIIALQYRKHIRPMAVIKPAVLFTACSLACIQVAKMVDQVLMKMILGLFLVLLAVYFLFIKKGGKAMLSPAMQVFCIVFSGMCDGLFGIGGPLMVVYYLSQTEGTEEYLGTIQAFFCLCSTVTIGSHAMQGLLTVDLVPTIVMGAVLVAASSQLAGRLVANLDANVVRKLTYVVIGLAGMYNAAVSGLTLLG